MNHFILALIFGVIGGFLNCILFHNGFTLPYKEQKEDSKGVRIDPGFFGNILLGGAASIIMYGLGVNGFDPEKIIAISCLSGIGGGSFIVMILQSKQMISQSKQMAIQSEQLDIQQLKIKSLSAISKQLIKAKKNSKSKKNN